MRQYISWIPTNLGLLQYEFINALFGEEQEEEINYSDTITKKEIGEELVFRFKYKLEKSNFNGELLKFRISVFPQDGQSESDWLFKVKNGTVYKNGKIVFECVYNEEMLSDNSDTTNVPNAIFTFIKQKIHIDIHHKEKIDNIIPVIKTNHEYVWMNCTIEKLALHIKRLEYDAKRIYHDHSRFERFSKIGEIYLDALGVEAYRKSFIDLFFNSNYSYSKRVDTSNVLESLKVLSKKIEKERNKYFVYAGLLTTAITLFISMSLVLHNHYGLDDKSTNFKLTLTLLVVWFVIDILYHLYFGKTLLLLPTRVKAKELYQRVFLAGRENLEQLPKKYMFLYLFLEYGEYILFFVALVMLFLLFLKS